MTQILSLGAITPGTTLAAPVGFPTLSSVAVVIGVGGTLCLKLVWV